MPKLSELPSRTITVYQCPICAGDMMKMVGFTVAEALSNKPPEEIIKGMRTSLMCDDCGYEMMLDEQGGQS